jgi:hypothetical protein
MKKLGSAIVARWHVAKFSMLIGLKGWGRLIWRENGMADAEGCEAALAAHRLAQKKGLRLSSMTGYDGIPIISAYV